MAKYEFIHHKATLFGTMFGGTEIWTTSFALGQLGGGDEGDAPTDAEAQAISDAFTAIWTPVANGFSSQFKFEGVKVSHVVTDGTADPALSRFHYRPVPVSGGAGPTNPAQISAVATLQTAIARGRGSKGRMFLPGVGFTVGADGKMTVAQATTLAGQVKTFLDVVNASADVPGVVVLNSQEVTGVPFKAADTNKVVSVKVGTVYDTQRRRRNNLVEAYSLSVLA
jgi:hypothetical protein